MNLTPNGSRFVERVKAMAALRPLAALLRHVRKGLSARARATRRRVLPVAMPLPPNLSGSTPSHARRKRRGPTPLAAGAPSLETAPTGGRLLLLPIASIHSAPHDSRIVYEHLEELADSIGGTADIEGVGVLSPILIRLTEDGVHHVIDGERRFRACRMLAERSPSGDFAIPAVVFNVSARVATLMRHVATLEHDDWKAYEVALSYQQLRDEFRDEGGNATSARRLTACGRHGKSQISDYLRIADHITKEVMIAAGLVTSHGTLNHDILARLSKKQLLDAAKCNTVETRAAALKRQVDRVSESAPGSPAAEVRPTSSPEERRDEIANQKGASIRLRTAARMMDPSEAHSLIENELAPAMLAMVERAHGGRNATGYYSALAVGHVCLVLPRELEGLTLTQLDRLDRTLASLAERTRRAIAYQQSAAEECRRHAVSARD